MIRVGRATEHSNETRGFHAPGTTGPFGAAVACGKLLGFSVQQMTNALGIAGSLEVGDRALSRHNIKAPSNVMIGQYSIPFCTALALVGDPADPRTFRDADVSDPQIRWLSDRIHLVPWSAPVMPSPNMRESIRQYST